MANLWIEFAKESERDRRSTVQVSSDAIHQIAVERPPDCRILDEDSFGVESTEIPVSLPKAISQSVGQAV